MSLTESEKSNPGNANIKILQTPGFRRVVKKLHKRDKKSLDDAIRTIAKDPDTGIQKSGDLIGIRVYKFRAGKKRWLLAYSYEENEDLIILTLLSLGTHENFYRDLKRKL